MNKMHTPCPPQAHPFRARRRQELAEAKEAEALKKANATTTTTTTTTTNHEHNENNIDKIINNNTINSHDNNDNRPRARSELPPANASSGWPLSGQSAPSEEKSLGQELTKGP